MKRVSLNNTENRVWSSEEVIIKQKQIEKQWFDKEYEKFLNRSFSILKNINMGVLICRLYGVLYLHLY